jgi:gas vesicle protein
MKTAKGFLLGMLVGLVVAFVLCFLFRGTLGKEKTPVSATSAQANEKGSVMITTEILEECIKDVSRYESLQVNEKVHQTHAYKGNSNDLVVSGKAIYTTDFAGMKVENFQEDSKTLAVILPLPKITTAALDEQHMVFDSKTTTLQHLKELFVGDDMAAFMLSENLKEADEKIRSRANTIGNLTKAKENADGKIKEICERLGWKVTILWSNT